MVGDSAVLPPFVLYLAVVVGVDHDMDSTKIVVVHAFVTSTLEYEKPLLYAIPKTKINKFEAMLNAAPSNKTLQL